MSGNPNPPNQFAEGNEYGRPSTYDAKHCAEVIKLGREGKSPAQISAIIGVPRTTMRSWTETHDDFKAAMEEAKTLEQAWWENIAQENLKADKFQAVLWTKSVQARFREDYTERKDVTTSGTFVIQASKADEEL
jgi:uncharacterized NAD(P)/FAD-binding protein YdhS